MFFYSNNAWVVVVYGSVVVVTLDCMCVCVVSDMMRGLCLCPVLL